MSAGITGGVPAGITGVVPYRVLRAQKPVVGRERNGKVYPVGPVRTGGHLAPVPRAARVERLGIINDAGVVIDEGRVGCGIVQHRPARVPTRRIRRVEPEVVSGERTRHLRITPIDNAFAIRRIHREHPRVRRSRKHVLWERVYRSQTVGSLDVKAHARARRLPRNRGRIHSVAGHAVSTGAVVDHGDRRVGGAGFDAVLQPQGGAVRIRSARSDDNGLAVGRQNGSMDHVINRRAHIGDCSAVGGAGGPEVRLNVQPAAHLEGAAMDAEQDLRPAAHPFKVSPQ